MINPNRIAWLSDLSENAKKMLTLLVMQGNEKCKAKIFARYRDNWHNLELSPVYTVLGLSVCEAVEATNQLLTKDLIEYNGVYQVHLDYPLLRECIKSEWECRISIKRLQRKNARLMRAIETIGIDQETVLVYDENGNFEGVEAI